MSQITDMLSEMLSVSQDRDRLADRVAELEKQIEEARSAKAHQTEIDRIDQVVAELFSAKNAAEPVGPLVTACVNVLEAAKLLLQAAQRQIVR